MDQNDLAWTAFRASLLSPLLTGEVSSGERGAYFQKLASQVHQLPSGKQSTISLRTLRRWYQRLRAEGIEGLQPKRRRDRGQPQTAIQSKIARAIELKREQPSRSHRVINRILLSELGSGLTSSTLYRHLRSAGATRRQLGIAKEKVRCRWSRDTPNSLWMGDFSQGPIVLHQGKAWRTHISAWIDSHSRYVVEARYYLRENLDILVDSLLRAWAAHGSSRELYADNGKVYHSNGLVLACAKLNIAKLHRPPREPEPGGLIERFFQTVQTQFGAEVDASQTLTLDELNRAFAAWLATAYHQDIHRTTSQSPHSRYFTEHRLVRSVAVEDVESCFYKTHQRTVDLTFSDVTLESRWYRVDPKFRGMKVHVQCNPFIEHLPQFDPQQPDEVKLFNEQGIYIGVGVRYERERGAHPPSSPAKPQGPIQSSYIDALLKDHQRAQSEARQQGIDYRSAMAHGQLTLASLGQLVARLLGRSGGLSSLTGDELQALDNFFAKHPQVSSSQVRTAFEQAAGGGFESVLWNLQQPPNTKGNQ